MNEYLSRVFTFVGVLIVVPLGVATGLVVMLFCWAWVSASYFVTVDKIKALSKR